MEKLTLKKAGAKILMMAFLFISTAFAEVAATKQGASNMKIKIQITSQSGSHSLTAELLDNPSAAAFYQLVKKETPTITLTEYGSFEKVGSLGTSLPQNDRQVKTSAGDIMLYQGNQITIFYGRNSWSYTPLGKVISASSSTSTTIDQAELKKILGKGNVTAVFSVDE